MADESKKKTLGVLLFPDFELLDVYGPVEMFGNLKDLIRVVMVAEDAGSIESTQGPRAIADYGFEDCPRLDFLLVPGGWGTRSELKNDVLIDWVKARGEEAEIVMSVCSGSALLAKAGLLDGRPATSNKKSFDSLIVEGPDVKWVREARWVDDGDRVTSSGVSAGIDMALAVIERLYGQETAETLAKHTEYNRETDPNNDPFANVWTRQ